MHTEFAPHGTPAVFRPGMVGYLIELASDDGGRDADLAGFLRTLGTRVVRCGTDERAWLRFGHPRGRPVRAAAVEDGTIGGWSDVPECFTGRVWV